MPYPGEGRTEYQADVGHRRFKVTVYIGGLKVTGIAYYASDTRTTSQRASDFINSQTMDRVTLSSPKIYERTTGLVIDEPPFIVLTFARIDAIHAVELDQETE